MRKQRGDYNALDFQTKDAHSVVLRFILAPCIPPSPLFNNPFFTFHLEIFLLLRWAEMRWWLFICTNSGQRRDDGEHQTMGGLHKRLWLPLCSYVV